MSSKTERIEVRDWYQDVRKVREACPNWTKDIEEYAQDADGRVRCRVARREEW